MVAIELDEQGHFTGRTVLSRAEQQPRGLTMSPTASSSWWRRSDRASLYRIVDGALAPLDRIEVGRGPNWSRCVWAISPNGYGPELTQRSGPAEPPPPTERRAAERSPRCAEQGPPK